jgi:hypothetical protein
MQERTSQRLEKNLKVLSEDVLSIATITHIPSVINERVWSVGGIMVTGNIGEIMVTWNI